MMDHDAIIIRWENDFNLGEYRMSKDWEYSLLQSVCGHLLGSGPSLRPPKRRTVNCIPSRPPEMNGLDGWEHWGKVVPC